MTGIDTCRARRGKKKKKEQELRETEARSSATAAVLHRNDETGGRGVARFNNNGKASRNESEMRSLDGHDDERSIAIV